MAASRLSVMNFLNEIAEQHVEAISFASGRPTDTYLELDHHLAAITTFQRHLAEHQGAEMVAVGRLLLQYGSTNGLINELVAKQLRNDEHIVCSPSRILMSSGCQEALTLCIQTLCSSPGDIVLVRNPTYIGAIGAADCAGIELVSFSSENDTFGAALQSAIARSHQLGKRPRVLYLIPDFDNPTGSVLSNLDRELAISICARHHIVILEDNPYGMFRFDGTTELSLAALDTQGVVIYLGTFSKTICPSVRVGFAVIPETFFGDPSVSQDFLAELSQRKSFLTVNTSQLNQALVGGVLLTEGYSLKQIIAPARHHYHQNRDILLAQLAHEFSNISDLVQWNFPAGGFFMSVKLPFPFLEQELAECVSKYHVIPMPMSFFSLDATQNNKIRLAFSNITAERIVDGVNSLAQYVRNRLSQLRITSRNQ
jgi:(S)-3,5-dihydroxyphenylglycine transaminase